MQNKILILNTTKKLLYIYKTIQVEFNNETKQKNLHLCSKKTFNIKKKRETTIYFYYIFELNV